MPYTRAVWILDGLFYLTYLEECFIKMSNQFPWLSESKSVEYKWDWRSSASKIFEESTRKDALINWIIREELERCYLLSIRNHIRVPEFEQIHNKLEVEFGLSKNTLRYLLIPKIYGDVDSRFVSRINAAIIIEHELEQPPIRRHVT